MLSKERAIRQIAERGPRYAVIGSIRPGEAETCYADTADVAERIRQRMENDRWYQVRVYPPVGSVDLAALARERAEAKHVFDEKTEILRAGVLRALEEGRSEVEVARTAGVDRMTVRKWAGK